MELHMQAYLLIHLLLNHDGVAEAGTAEESVFIRGIEEGKSTLVPFKNLMVFEKTLQLC